MMSFYGGGTYLECRLVSLAGRVQLSECNEMRHACQLTFGSDRRSSRPASRKITATSHIYAFVSSQPVASCFPPAENDTQFKSSACWRGKQMGRPLSRFHNRAVLSCDALARMRPFGDIAIAMAMAVSRTAVCCHLVVFHVLQTFRKVLTHMFEMVQK
jgi:hypothetical protein